MDNVVIEALEYNIKGEACPFCGNTVGLKKVRILVEHPYFTAIHCSRPYGCGAIGSYSLEPRIAEEMWNRRIN